MSLSHADWHRRFSQQANWTRQLRSYLLGRLELSPASRILEVGCGTGVITAGLGEDTPARVYGLDLNRSFLRLARQNGPGQRLIGGNAMRLPFADGQFHAVVCHFFLLWVQPASSVLAEMARITRPGGAVIAFAEPDYGGRIDYPPPLDELGRLQGEALRGQGAEPNMGRQLSGLFHAVGLGSVETGLLGAQWQGRPSPAEIDSEWAVLEADLADTLPEERLRALRRTDEAARAAGQRVLFVPTFYAIGLKTNSQ